MAFTPPTVTVIDLTARLGLYSLAQLGVANVSGPGPWLQIPLSDATMAPLVDWLRPANAKALSLPSATSAAVILLVGPGSVHLVQATLQWLAPLNPPVVWAFLMPNALMEESIFKSAPAEQMARTHVYQLPDSSPQTLWFILMEQLGKLRAMDDLAAHQQSQTLLQTGDMSSNLKQCMDTAMTIDGAQAVALVDYRSGMCLAQAGGGINLDLAAAGNTEVVRAKLKTMESLGLRRGIEDILITLGDQYHLIRLVPNNQGLFLYLVLDKTKGNLALARYKLTDIERSLKV
jgi:hypothetical protein